MEEQVEANFQWRVSLLFPRQAKSGATRLAPLHSLNAELPLPQVPRSRLIPLDWYIAAALALASLVLFWPAMGFSLLTYDDGEYVTDQPMVNEGIRPAAILWMLSHAHAGNWHPVTTFAHMTMCSVFEVDADAHHALNIVIHAVNAALCFLVLRRFTGHRWPSAFAAAIFAIHPLRVESVVWVAELKDLLCGLFWFLALLAYAHYLERRTRARYALVFSATVAALLSKPMAVTLPATLLLLDYWPLRRWPVETWATLIREKLWLFLLVAVHSMVVLWVQFGSGAATFAMRVPFAARLGNAVVSYGCYLEKFFWPVKLAVLYPHPIWWSWTSVLLSSVALAGISGLAWHWRRAAPRCLMGWLWFLGTLVPVIGFIQVGMQAMADRYTYIPAIGLAIAITWTAAHVLRALPRGRWVANAGATVVLVALAIACRTAMAPWRDSVALFEHAMRVNDRPSVIRNWLAVALSAAGRQEDAARQLRSLVQDEPDFPNGYVSLSVVLAKMNRPDEAVAVMREAVDHHPKNPQLWNNLGIRLLAKGALPEARDAFEQAALLAPGDGPIDTNLATYYTRAGQPDRAEDCLRRAIRKNPWDPANYNDLAVNLGSRGSWIEARRLLEKGLWIDPRGHNLLLNYATLLERHGETEAAEKYRMEAERWKGVRSP
jgi:Flp pilus assembly protein TadD